MKLPLGEIESSFSGQIQIEDFWVQVRFKKNLNFQNRSRSGSGQPAIVLNLRMFRLRSFTATYDKLSI